MRVISNKESTIGYNLAQEPKRKKFSARGVAKSAIFDAGIRASPARTHGVRNASRQCCVLRYRLLPGCRKRFIELPTTPVSRGLSCLYFLPRLRIYNFAQQLGNWNFVYSRRSHNFTLNFIPSTFRSESCYISKKKK